jgi:hypothetical protein
MKVIYFLLPRPAPFVLRSFIGTFFFYILWLWQLAKVSIKCRSPFHGDDSQAEFVIFLFEKGCINFYNKILSHKRDQNHEIANGTSDTSLSLECSV